jgi:hypothetical protein
MQSASVYKRKDGWYLHADSRSNGAWVATPPFLKLPLDAPLESLGEAVKTAIDASRGDVPFPTDWEPVFQPVLDLAGVKSWTTFARGAKYMGAMLKNSIFTFLPYRQDRGNFSPLEDLAFDVSGDGGPAEMGEAVQRGMALCE